MRALVIAALCALVLAAGGVSAGPPEGQIVFVQLVEQDFELFRVRPDGSGLVRLTSNRLEDEAPTWSPDGRRLLSLLHGRLVLRSADGRLRRRLPASGFEPSWSPDGSLIAYLTGRCVDPRGTEDVACADLWVIRPDGTGRRRLAAADVDLTLDAHPYAWAPDSRRLVYAQAGGPGSLVVVAAWDGRKRTLGGTHRTLCTDPTWSPDGRSIAFSRQRGPFRGFDLYVVGSDGTGLRRLARGRSISRATWSPDGRRIAYLRSLPLVKGLSRYALIVAEADGSRARRLAVIPDNRVLVWSPDSSHLLWSAPWEHLTIAPADGSGRPTVVTEGEEADWG